VGFTRSTAELSIDDVQIITDTWGRERIWPTVAGYNISMTDCVTQCLFVDDYELLQKFSHQLMALVQEKNISVVDIFGEDAKFYISCEDEDSSPLEKLSFEIFKLNRESTLASGTPYRSMKASPLHLPPFILADLMGMTRLSTISSTNIEILESIDTVVVNRVTAISLEHIKKLILVFLYFLYSKDKISFKELFGLGAFRNFFRLRVEVASSISSVSRLDLSSLLGDGTEEEMSVLTSHASMDRHWATRSLTTQGFATQWVLTISEGVTKAKIKKACSDFMTESFRVCFIEKKLPEEEDIECLKELEKKFDLIDANMVTNYYILLPYP
jgi:hypothetical protein